MTDETNDENTPRQMIDIDAVLRLVPISVSTVYRLTRRGLFPPSRVIAGKRFWFAADVARWQRNLDVSQGRSAPVRAEAS